MPENVPESVKDVVTGEPAVAKGPAAWSPTVDEYQSLLALLGSDGSLDGVSAAFGENVLPYVIKALCLELRRLRNFVDELTATSKTVDAMLGGMLGVALPTPQEGEDAEARRLMEDIYRVGAQQRARIEMLEAENISLRTQLDAVVDQLAAPRSPGHNNDPVVISAAQNAHR